MKISIIPMFISLYLFCLIPVHSSFWLQIAAWPWVMRTVTGDLHKADSWVRCCCCSCSCCCSCCNWSCTCVAALPDMCPVLVPLTVIAQVQTVLRLRPTFIVNSLLKYYRNIILGLENGRPLFGLRCNLPEHWEASPPNSAALTVTLHDLLPSHFSWTLYIASFDSPCVFLACRQM